MEVEVVTANADVHSGRFGGSIPNAAVALANVVSQLHESTGAVAVPGFYEVGNMVHYGKGFEIRVLNGGET
eukprot:1161446-Pelagomonas_calceolata.AAC.6